MVSVGQAGIFHLTLPTYSQPTEANGGAQIPQTSGITGAEQGANFPSFTWQKQASLCFPAKIVSVDLVERHQKQAAPPIHCQGSVSGVQQ